MPGLGGFVSEYEPAAFDINENSFIPPSKKISFNTKFSYHDNLLVNFISKKEKIDIEKAKEILENFIRDLKIRLKRGEKIDFAEIGSLSQNAKGAITFKQDVKSNLLTDSFGLTSIKTNKITTENSKETKPAEQKKSYKKIIIIGSSAIVFLCFIGLTWILTEGYSDFSLILSNKRASIQPIDNDLLKITEKNLDSIAKEDSIKALINQSIDENTDKIDALFYTEPKKEEPKPKYSKFHIIAGSFNKVENADIFSAKLKEEGFEPKLIHSSENLIRIALFSYTNETEALTKLYKLRETSGIKSVWILKSI